MVLTVARQKQHVSNDMQAARHLSVPLMPYRDSAGGEGEKKKNDGVVAGEKS